MDKKQRERTILSLIYDESEYCEVVDFEIPDFLVQHRNEDTFFGVEVTEVYYSDASARIKRVSDYFQLIVDKDVYLHKKDKKVLKVVEADHVRGDELLGTARLILYKTPPIEQYVEMIVDAIVSKNAKVLEYLRSVTHVNLVVFDAESNFITFTAEEVYRKILSPSMKQALMNSRFREIFFITMLEKNRRVYIPLKMTLLMLEFYVFTNIVLKIIPDMVAISGKEQMHIFAEYLATKTKHIYMRDSDNEVEVIFGNSAVWYCDGELKGFVDYYDCSLPSDAKLVEASSLSEFFSSPEFRELEAEVSTYTFSTQHVYDVKKEVML